MEKTMSKIQAQLRDAANEAEDLMWLEIKQIQTQIFDNKSDQIKQLKKIAHLINLFAASRDALGKTHNLTIGND